MAKKIITEVVEIEAGAVLSAIQRSGWPVSSVEKLEVLDPNGQVIGSFGGLRFTYVREERIDIRVASDDAR